MKKLSSIFAALCLIALSIVACSKQDEKNNNDSSDNAITTDFLVGNWQPIEFEIDGLKISNNPSYQSNGTVLSRRFTLLPKHSFLSQLLNSMSIMIGVSAI